jgi:ribosome recycling factor
MIAILILLVTSTILTTGFRLPVQTRLGNSVQIFNGIGEVRLAAKSKKGGGAPKKESPKKKGGGSSDDGDFTWKDFRKGVDEKMKASLDACQGQMNTLRASGANPTMLDRVFVDYFGALTPLNQVASIGTNGANQLTIDPFDKSILGEVEKAISMSDLNLNPQNDGTGLIRINVPQLTEERRKELVKQAKSVAEDGKVSVRNHRRDAVDKVKDLEKKSGITKDDSKAYQDDLQKLTDEYGKKIDAMFKAKETDLLKV